jgi:hypothetical protein
LIDYKTRIAADDGRDCPAKRTDGEGVRFKNVCLATFGCHPLDSVLYAIIQGGIEIGYIVHAVPYSCAVIAAARKAGATAIHGTDLIQPS